MFDFLTVEEAMEKWNVSMYQVRKLCQDGKIPGAVKKSGIWFVPGQAEYPNKFDIQPCQFRGTKQRVFEASVKLFADHGFDAVTLRDISDAAHLAQSAIYRHFETKQEILDAIYDFFLYYYTADRPKVEELDAVIHSGSPREVLQSVIYNFSPEYEDMLIDCTKIVIQRLSVDERAAELFRDLLLGSGLDYAERVYQRAIEAGTLPDADPYVLSVFTNTSRHAILLNWLAHADPAMNEKMVQCMDTLTELIILGLIVKGSGDGGNIIDEHMFSIQEAHPPCGVRTNHPGRQRNPVRSASDGDLRPPFRRLPADCRADRNARVRG